MSFRARVVTPPAPIVSFEEAKRRLRDLADAEQADVEAMIAAATDHIDGPRGWLGRAIGKQTLEVDFAGFDSLASELPYPEVVSIETVSYLDIIGTRVTLPAASYEALGGRLVPVIGTAWPASVYVSDDRAAVRVRYVAGYEVVPASIKTAVLLMVGSLYADRESAPSVSGAAASYLELHRVYA